MHYVETIVNVFSCCCQLRVPPLERDETSLGSGYPVQAEASGTHYCWDMVAMCACTESLVVFTAVHGLMPCHPHSLGMLAETHGWVAQPEAGLTALRERRPRVHDLPGKTYSAS
jgi:hypothetical protein